MNSKQEVKKLAFSCPVCARITDREISKLKEGATIVCEFCGLKLNLHGHMLESVNAQIADLTDEKTIADEPA
ncbi:MAG: hypothetical protein Q8P24_12460 [Desulfobacterales bacterium]|nr:hypothetical protein [Desulfobacterales bacterium]